MPGYAVIDLETTGFSPPKHHRILEIGVVEVSDDGEIERGYAPGNITKKTALVVAADPNSQSGEAAEARAYEIPMITEAAFARMVGA